MGHCLVRRVLVSVSIIFMGIQFSVASLNGQVPDPVIAAQAPVPGAGHNYIGMGAETVNPADGSLSFDLPFDPPAGRGISLKFGLRFAGTEQFYLSNSTTANGTLVWTPDWQSGQAPWQIGAWSYDLPILTAQASILVTGTEAVNCSQFGCTYYTNRCYGNDSFVFRGLDGRQYSLPMIGNMFPDSNNYNQYFCPLPPNNYKSPGNDHGILSIMNPNNYSVTVVDASGTTYQFPGAGGPEPQAPYYSPTMGGSLASSITDRNGNQILQSGNGLAYTDSIGRPVLSWTGMGNNGDQITVAGLAGPVTLKWINTPVSFPEGGSNIGNNGNCSLGGGLVHSVPVISEIDLPNIQQYPNQKYTFTYDGTYGMISKITFPDGGYVRYLWGLNRSAQLTTASWTLQSTPPTLLYCDFKFDLPAITDRYVSFDGVTEVLHQHFTYSTTWNGPKWTSKQTIVQSTDQLTSQVTQTVYTYGSVAADGTVYGGPSLAYLNDIPVETNVLYKDGTGKIYKEVNKTWAEPHLMLSEQTILYDSSGNRSVGNATVRCYDANEQVTNLYEFGFQTEGAFPGNQSCINVPNTSYVGPLRRQTTTAYHPFFSWNGSSSPPTYSGTHIVDAPDSVTIADGSGSTVAQTTFTYSNTVQPSSTAVGLVAPPGTQRGNIASISKLVSTGTWATTSFTYFDTGQLQSMTDSCGNSSCSDVTGTNHTTTYSYADQFASGTGSAPGETNAYLTSVVYPNTSTAHSRSYTWGYNDGLLMSVTDDQNQTTTSFAYNDPLARLTQISYPDTGLTTVAYNDSPYSPGNNTPNFSVTKAITGTLNLTTVSAFDGLGHSVRSVLSTDPDGPDTTDSGLDGFSRARTLSNPYRSAAASTDGTSTTSYDALGRVTSILRADGSTVSTSYSGQCTTVTDEAGKSRKSCTDGLGHLVQVFEDPAGANYETDYTYDALGNLLTVNQKGSAPTDSTQWRTRTFTYDSLSRLLTANNPESGTVMYTYDANGNVVTKTAPMPNQQNPSVTVTTTFQYDVLNRLTQKSYSDGTPNANFYYDTAPAAWASGEQNTVGRLVEATTGHTPAP